VSDIPENLEVSDGIAVTFRAGDTRSLAGGIERMLEMDPGERERRGREARARVQERYNWDQVAEALESLYLELLS
jgi:glycosyltransferase involved in cell wall biosynthesis